MKTLVFFVVLHVLLSWAFQSSPTWDQTQCPPTNGHKEGTCCPQLQEPLVKTTNENIVDKMNIADPPPGNTDIYANTMLSNQVRSKLCSNVNHVILNGNTQIGTATTSWEGFNLRVSFTLQTGFCWNTYSAYADTNSINSKFSSFPPFSSSSAWLTGANTNKPAGCTSGSFLFSRGSSGPWTNAATCNGNFFVAFRLSVTTPTTSTVDAWLSPANPANSGNKGDGDGRQSWNEGCPGVCFTNSYPLRCNGDTAVCGSMVATIDGNSLGLDLTMSSTWTLNAVYVYLDTGAPPALPASSSSFSHQFGTIPATSNPTSTGCTYGECPVSGCCPSGCLCVSFQAVAISTVTSSGVTTISFKVTNRCKWGISYVAIGTLGLTVVSPASGSTYTCSGSLCPPNGGPAGAYSVVYTNTNGNPGFPSVKFTPVAGGASFVSGAWDIFTIQVTGWTSAYQFALQGHIGQEYSTYTGFSLASCSLNPPSPPPACVVPALVSNLTSTTASLTFDLTKNVFRSCVASTCNSNFNWAVKIWATSGTGSGVAAGTYVGWAQLPTKYSGFATSSPIPADNWGYYATTTRCCKKAELSLSCNTKDDCVRTMEFKDDLKWATAGSQLLVPTCCPIQEIVKLLNILLPEGKSPYKGFTAGNVQAKCKDNAAAPCTMAMTWLVEGAGYRNYVGYHYLNDRADDVDRNFFVYPNAKPGVDLKGYGSLWPDTSASGSQGCLNAGDTVMVANVPQGKTVGWYMRMNAADYTRFGNLNANVWYSYINTTTGSKLVNSDGMDGSAPPQPYRHYGWINIDKLEGLMIFGIEDLAKLGDRDYNDAVFGIKLNGEWDLPGLLTYDPCTDTVLQCVTFTPYNYADFVFTPGCIPTIPLDPGVGTDTKECQGYYSIPDGWTIATLDDAAKSASGQFGAKWKSNCLVGLSSASATLSNGQTVSGFTPEGATCSVTVNVLSNPKNPSQKCYNLGCNGYLLLRQNTQNPNCNIKNYGLYCDDKSGSSYYSASSTSSDPSAVYLNLFPGASLQVPFQVPLLDRINVLVLIDVWNIAVNTDPLAIIRTLPYFWTSTGMGTFVARGVAIGFNPSTTTPFQLSQSITYDPNAILKTAVPSGTFPTGTVDSNILDSVLAVTSASSTFGWKDDTPRYIYLITRNPPRASSVTDALKTALRTSGVRVIFIASTTTLQVQWNTLIQNQGLSAFCAATSGYPDISTCGTTASCIESKALWLSNAITASRPFLGQLTIEKDSDPANFMTATPTVSVVSGFGTTLLPDYQFYPTNPATFVLPADVSTLTMPYAASYIVRETGRKFSVFISWNKAPTLLQPVGKTFNFNDVDKTPFIINLVDAAVASSLDANGNSIDIIYDSYTFVSGTTGGWVSAVSINGGKADGQGFQTNVRFNSLGLKLSPLPGAKGTLEIKYRLYDGCAYTPGSITVIYTLTNPPPTAKDIVITVPFGQSQPVSFTEYISDEKTALSALTIGIYTNWVTTFGKLLTSTSSAEISYNTPLVDYQKVVFTPNANTWGTRVWTYTVFNQVKLSATATLTIIIPEPNYPPRIKAVPTTVTTVPGQVGTWLVTIEDTAGDTNSLWIKETTNIKFEHIASTPIFGVSPDQFSTPAPITSTTAATTRLLDGLIQPASGSTSFQMQWQPLLTHPYGLTHTFTLYAQDAAGLVSEFPVVINLGIPPNLPPSWEGTKDQTTYPQYSDTFPINVFGTDPNDRDKENLSITITTLPTKGKLTIGDREVVAGQEIPLSSALSPPLERGHTYFPFKYTPYTSWGDDSFTGYFTDPGKLNSPVGTIPITLTKTDTPPVTYPVSAFTTMNNPVTVTVTATDRDSNVASLTILSINLLEPTKTTISFNGKPIAVGDVFPLPDGIKASWDFTYLTSDWKGKVDTFTYKATDDTKLDSDSAQGTITVTLTPIPPVVWSDTFTTGENQPITLPFNFKNRNSDPSDPLGHYYNYDENPATTLIIIKSLPATGVLYKANSDPITVDTVLDSATKEVTWIPPLHSTSSVSFDFVSTNAVGLTSGTATFTIDIIPFDDPPTISLTPSSISVDRKATGYFNCTFSDIDSDTIEVYVDSADMPWTYSELLADTTLFNKDNSGSFVGSRLYTKTGPGGVGVSGSFELAWSPYYTAPDGTSGTYSVKAVADGKSSDTPYPIGKVAVTPNLIPTVVGTPDYYTITVDQNSDPVTLTLKGTDLDPWHQNVLDFQLKDIPTSGITVGKSSGTEYTGTVDKVDGAYESGTETHVDVEITFTHNWNGETSFTFTVRDLLGAVSTEQKVYVKVNWVNQPPEIDDYEITIPEDFCVLSPCLVDLTKSETFATFVATDPDDTVLTLQWGSLPDAADGELVQYTTGSSGSLSPITSEGPYDNGKYGWVFWYQPVPNKNSLNCDTECDPYDVIPFEVLDTRGLSSGTHTLTIYVTPVPHPPTSKSVAFLAERNVALPFSIAAWDLDEDLISLTIIHDATSYPFTVNAQTDLRYGDASGTQITGASGPFTIAATGSGSFDFTYTYAGPTATTDVFYFVVDDESNLTSVLVYSATIDVRATPYIPETWSESFTTNEDTPIEIEFDWGDGDVDTGMNFWDSFYDQDQVTITITELPSEGTLRQSDGALVEVGKELPDFTIAWTPVPDSTTTPVYIKFTCTNAEGEVSNESTLTINVISVDDPPTITLVPDHVSVDRLSTGSFTITVDDVDSTEIKVTVEDLDIPFTYSEISFHGVTYDFNSPLTSSTLVATVTGTYGNFPTIPVVWGPYVTAPDGTEGWFQVYGEDATSKTSNHPRGTVDVTPNKIPYVVQPSESYYTVSVDQYSDFYTLTLIGADPDSWHTTSLLFDLLSLPEGVGIREPGGNIITSADYEFTQTKANFDDNTTTTDIELVFDKFWGDTSFTFRVIDDLDAPSPEQLVTIHVTYVNLPPTSKDYVLIVPSDYCALGCHPDRYVQIEVVDEDPSYKLFFENTSFPVDPERGTLAGLTSSNATEGDWKAPPHLGPHIFPDNPLTYSFQAVPLAHSTGCASFYFGEGVGDITGCAEYAKVAFYIEDNDGLQSVEHYITIYVLPIPHKPTTQDVTVTAVTPVPVKIPIPSADPDNDVVGIIIQTINFDRDDTTLTYDGKDVEIGKLYDGKSWEFTYTHTHWSATTDTFTYIVIDATELTSDEHTATINVDRTLKVPKAWGDSYTTRVNTPVDIPLPYGNRDAGTTGNYYDEDGEPSTVRRFIRTLPSHGVLLDGNADLEEGEEIKSNTLTWRPGQDNEKAVEFSFQARDSDDQDSNVATISVTIPHENKPPTLTLTPLTQTVDRNQRATFLVEAADIDSPSIRVKLPGFTIPLKYTSFSVFDDVDLPDRLLFNSEKGPAVNEVFDELRYSSPEDYGKPMGFFVEWLPSVDTPDNTQGSFTLVADDYSEGYSNEVVGFVAVTPNIPPFTIERKEGDYSFTAEEGSWKSHTFTLVGSDPDEWHKERCVIQITSLPDSGILLTIPDKPDSPLTLVPFVIPSKGGNGESFGDIIVTPREGWYGTTSFTYSVVDPFGAVSEKREVTITVNPLPAPPTASDETIYMYENTCFFTYCNQNPNLDDFKYAHVKGEDRDTPRERLSLEFKQLADPKKGIMGYRPSASSSKFGTLDTTGPFPQSDTEWKFWYQPVPGQASEGCTPTTLADCKPYDVVPFIVKDDAGQASAIHTITVVVFPVNVPPASTSLIFTIDEDTELVVFYLEGDDQKVFKLPGYDSDNTDGEISATSHGFTGRGTFYDEKGATVSRKGDTPLVNRYLRFVPPANDFSADTPMATLTFTVSDPEPLTSPTYTVQIFVVPKPDKPKWISPLEITILEDSEGEMTLNRKDVDWTSVDPGSAYVTITKIDKGTYKDCIVTGGKLDCKEITQDKLPYLLRSGSVTYRPLQDENGHHYSFYDFTLSVTNDVTKIGDPANSLSTRYWVNVLPVNDPPVLIPHPSWRDTSHKLLKNWCDEDTYVRVNFTATDIDSPLSSLEARTGSYLAITESNLFSCANTKAANCSDGQRIITLQKITKVSTAFWEVSFIPVHDWNGALQISFIVVDDYNKPSELVPCQVDVLPINDPPTIVKSMTTVVLEGYTSKWKLVGVDGDSPFEIHDEGAKEEKKLEGETITRINGKSSTLSTSKSGEKADVIVHRLKTKTQDVDYFFGGNPSIKGKLVGATFVKELTTGKDYQNCTFSGDYDVYCQSDLVALNTFLLGTGFPIRVKQSSNGTEGYGIFILDDKGNIDKWDRPLNATFVITFTYPADLPAAAAFPAAIAAALPVVAVGTSAIVAAAWLTGAKTATAAVNGYFDLHSVCIDHSATINPTYNADETVVHNPLFNAHAGAGR